MPSDTEIKAMKTLIEVLQHMVQITEAIGGEKLVTVSAVYCINFSHCTLLKVLQIQHLLKL